MLQMYRVQRLTAPMPVGESRWGHSKHLLGKWGQKSIWLLYI